MVEHEAHPTYRGYCVQNSVDKNVYINVRTDSKNDMTARFEPAGMTLRALVYTPLTTPSADNFRSGIRRPGHLGESVVVEHL